MSKVFRLHSTGGKNDKTDWFDCQSYDNTIINDIKDPDGADARRQITSIPSPFARIDLVKTSFAEVVNSRNLDGNTIYHRMVSESLDVAELFFNYNTPKIKEMFNIIAWNRGRDMAAFKSRNKEVADTIEMFLNQDARAYNFDRWQDIYMLQYVGAKHKQMQIVGFTSPCTLFCSTDIDFSAVSANVHFGQDNPFDSTFQPLYRRSDDFVKYLFTFKANCSDFSFLFKELDDYLTLTYNSMLTDEMRRYIDNLSGGSNSFGNYQELRFGTAQTVNILGYPFHTKGSQNVVDSDFEIRSTVYSGQKPLVLPCEIGNTYANWRYTQDNWGGTHKAPYKDNLPLDQRNLPFDNNRHPYLTICDLLEDTIIEIPDSQVRRKSDGTVIGGGFNHRWFFDGNRVDGGGNRATEDTVTLLPLRPLFFQFFTPEQLINGIDGHQMLAIYPNSAGYRVVLQIPTRKGFVVFERLYMTTREEELNKGQVMKLDPSVVFAMLPPVRMNSEQDAYYRLALSTDYAHRNTISMMPYHQGRELEVQPIVRNDRSEQVDVSQIISLDKQQFDFIQIRDRSVGADAHGVLLPKMRGQQTAGPIYRFAIDFGTTNTHIEYRKDTDKPRPMLLTADESPVQYLCRYGNRRYVLEADMLPNVIDEGSTFSFPTRTALVEPRNLNRDLPIKPLGHVSPSFTYEKRQTYSYSAVFPNLKWDPTNPQRAEEYIRSLVLIIRSKVLIEGGALGNTRVAWFYPTAMTGFMRNQFADMWERVYTEYFGNNLENIQSITESEAPYLAFRKMKNTSDNVITIDIGGGTTDVVVASGGKVQAITSFRFAADAIFGSGFTDGQGEYNGIVHHFEEQIASTLESNGMSDLLDILKELDDSGRSEDIASFLFSLRDNKAIKEKGIVDKVDLNAILRRDQDYKLVILLFYTSIIYHVAQILRIKGLPAPRTIFFSGNGSKVLQSIGSKRTLDELSRAIIEGVMGKANPNGTDTCTTDNPKEQTCRGGLQEEQPLSHNEAREKIVILRNDESIYSHTDYSAATTDEEKNEVISSVNHFLDFMKQLSGRYSFADNFGISKSSMGYLDTICRRDLDEFLSKGIHRKLGELKGDKTEEVQETMFFYPLTGMLNALCSEIYHQLHGEQTTEPVVYTFLHNYGQGMLEVVNATSAQFRLVKTGDEDYAEGEFEFCGEVGNALANRDATFDGAATVSGQGSQITTTEKGVARSVGNGIWEVIKQATIKIQ